MATVKLREEQKEAVDKMKTGCILCGGTGSGKSITSLAYYIKTQGGNIEKFQILNNPKDLIIITTARKRDSNEWNEELNRYLLSPENNPHKNTVIIDSWNNIKKYEHVKNSFFIFDEQRVVGNGTWVKTFLKITKFNEWILLSATPGDCWSDYIPVFIANGFYKNKSEFNYNHVVYSRYSKFPKIDKYLNTRRLERLRDRILIQMNVQRDTTQIHEDIFVDYDIHEYKNVMKDRWNYEENKPIESSAELCYQLRKVTNSHPSRISMVYNIVLEKNKVIIFYNFDYELEILHKCFDDSIFEVAEWNGHKHQDVPKTDRWVYLVQYNAGSEAWNCIQTDTIIFFSQNYSYKIMIQSSGRIDRLNTTFKNLYYYHLKTRSSIDVAISRALKMKKKFNEKKFIEG